MPSQKLQPEGDIFLRSWQLSYCQWRTLSKDAERIVFFNETNDLNSDDMWFQQDLVTYHATNIKSYKKHKPIDAKGCFFYFVNF